MGVRGSMLNYSLDSNTMDMVELRPFGVDSEIVVNTELLRATYYARILFKQGQGLCI
jgi:hypothetical protein